MEADQREREGNRFRARISLLRGPGIHDVLVDERDSAVSERVALQLLVRLALCERVLWCQGHSYLSATIGSTLVARRAGR